MKISGHKLISALIDAGILGGESKQVEREQIVRVVIDAKVDEVVVIHIQRHGDDRLLNVVPTLDGVEVRRGDQPPPGVGPEAHRDRMAKLCEGGYVTDPRSDRGAST